MNDRFTPIHNEVLEGLCKINLTSYETRVLFAIWRKTYGFRDKKNGGRKKKDWISGSQFSQLTLLDRRHVWRALQSLEKKGVICRDDKKIGFSKKFLSSVEMTRVICRDDKLSSVEAHTKERKENIQKKRKTSLNLLRESLKKKLILP